MNRWFISSFYKFVELTELAEIARMVGAEGEKYGIEGLFLLAREGCNATIAGERAKVDSFRARIEALPDIGAVEAKESWSSRRPFKRFTVQIRDEAVTLKRPDLNPVRYERRPARTLSPADWHKALSDSGSYTILDTRNVYETKIGRFKNAVVPKIENFSDFPAYLETAGLPADKPLLIYCTGGIRCEKALLALEEKGYENVFQLDGGILRYLDEYPEGHFEGECFVFDHRCAVNNRLEPSNRWHLCPHCGNPGEVSINCRRCTTAAVVCDTCAKEEARLSCSKNCRYHLQRLTSDAFTRS